MPKNLKHGKEIDAYLSGELAPEQVTEFEKRLQEEQELRDELEAMKRVIEGIEGYGFKQMLNRFHEELFGEDKDEQ